MTARNGHFRSAAEWRKNATPQRATAHAWAVTTDPNQQILQTIKTLLLHAPRGSLMHSSETHALPVPSQQRGPKLGWIEYSIDYIHHPTLPLALGRLQNSFAALHYHHSLWGA